MPESSHQQGLSLPQGCLPTSLSHSPWNIYRLGTTLHQGLSVPHLPLRIVPDSTARGRVSHSQLFTFYLRPFPVSATLAFRLWCRPVTCGRKRRDNEGRLGKKCHDCRIVLRMMRWDQWAVPEWKLPGGGIPHPPRMGFPYYSDMPCCWLGAQPAWPQC